MRLPLISFLAVALASTTADATGTGVIFSHNRGYYDAPFELTLATDMPGATIRFTTDSTPPGRETGTEYTDPILVTTTTVVRAIAFTTEEGSEVAETRSFLFLGDVVDQPTIPSGYIRSINSSRHGASRPHSFDWALDPDVVDDVANNGILADHLNALPALALTMDVDDFNYLYRNHTRRGVRYERPASVELIYPSNDPRYVNFQGFGVVCGIRMQGGGAVDQARKKSFRLLFKEEYGYPKLEYPLFESAVHHAASAVKRFDGVVLRAAGNSNWSKDDAWKHEPSTYLRDILVRDSQIAISGFGSRSVFVHLYINGLYFGLYNIAERPDEKFMASYFGGPREDYYSINHGGTVEGSSSVWSRVTRATNLSNLRDPDRFRKVKEEIDIVGFCDYIALNWLVGMGDWPWNNFYAGVRNGPEEGKVRFFSWDSEYAFWTIPGYLRSNPRGWANPNFRTESGVIATMWRALAANDDFLMTFADRVYRHCSEGGALSDAELGARFRRLADNIEGPIVAESARWGDSAWGRERNPHTRAGDWYPNVEAVLELIDGNAEHFIGELRRARYYPKIDPPTFPAEPGAVAPGTAVALTNPNGKGDIYYTLDGTDPRTPETGTVSDAALTIAPGGTPVAIDKTVWMKARVFDGDNWSALAEHLFTVEGVGFPLRITELMFHPPESQALEFVELCNTGLFPLDVSGFFFSGINFRFPPGTVLQPQETVVLTPNDDPVAFAARYPGVEVFGTYRGHLDNGGESVGVLDPQSKVIVEVTYGDSDPWPTTADGEGASLVLVDSGTDDTSAGNWQAGPIGGSPGVTSPPGEPVDSDGDGFSDALEEIAGTDPDDPRSYLKLEVGFKEGRTVTLAFDAVAQRTYRIQASDGLESGVVWSSLATIPPSDEPMSHQIEDTLPDGIISRYYRLVTP